MTSANRKKRSPNLEGHLLARVLEVILTMAGKPTWAGIIRAVRHETGVEYTRQALASHPSIVAAYERRRYGAGTMGGARMSAAARSREEATRRRNDVEAQLRRDLEAARERMVRWAYNAFVNSGLDETILDRPLPPKDDGRSARVQGRRGKRDWRERSR